MWGHDYVTHLNIMRPFIFLEWAKLDISNGKHLHGNMWSAAVAKF